SRLSSSRSASGTSMVSSSTESLSTGSESEVPAGTVIEASLYRLPLARLSMRPVAVNSTRDPAGRSTRCPSRLFAVMGLVGVPTPQLLELLLQHAPSNALHCHWMLPPTNPASTEPPAYIGSAASSGTALTWTTPSLRTVTL